jgi:hypothetical protein
MKSKLNELRLDAGIARIENQQWLCVLDKETGLMVDPLIGLEKFAELIVQECVEVCKSRVGNSDYNTGRMHCVSDLKEHFGIE